MIVTFTLIAAFVSTVWGAQVCCPNTGCFSDNPPFSHLPLPRCEDYINPEYLVYTRSNTADAQLMTRSSVPSVFSNSRKTFFLIHGYTNDKNTLWLRNMKNTLLNKGDYNVVVVGWGGGSQTLNYLRAASNTRVVGAETAALAQNLLNRGVSRSNLVCVGHSLGAHACGHAGKITKWGRISGLDPAGPLFENYDYEAGLNPSRANLVDVLHTMGYGALILDYGTLRPMGHIDFYPNGGVIQPGCATREYEDVKGDLVACSHQRAINYYMESIQDACFVARQSCTDERNIPGSCTSCGNNCQNMGIDADRYSARGKFFLETNSKSRFCKG